MVKKYLKLEDSNNEGQFVYADKKTIVGIYRDDEGDPMIDLVGDKYFVVTENDFIKILAWADTQSEEIPEVEHAAQGYQNGSWKEN